MTTIDISSLSQMIDGELMTDDLHRVIYATDASVYREMPIGVVYPRHKKDLQVIVSFCKSHGLSIIPRAGGTSLAGQCVGNGLVVDISRHMTAILDIDPVKKTATVQPGVIRDELNHHLRAYGLMFGPNTSTANRATIGGMVGNNSCGSTSIVFGTTRDHVQELEIILADGEIVRLTADGFSATDSVLVRGILRYVDHLQEDVALQEEITSQYPKKSVRRRNSGYALDSLLGAQDTGPGGLLALLCGSEGTLAITSEITIGLVDVPPPVEVLVAIHFETVDASLRAVPTIMHHGPFACELMDKTILDCTKGQLMYEQDRFFLEGDPLAVLLVSFVGTDRGAVIQRVQGLIDVLRSDGHGYAFPIISEKIDRVWNLRKAGLGLLANLPGDKKAVACIEDTAVAIEDLADYIADFSEIMSRFGQQSVYYAHAGDGEIHLRPILDLKRAADRDLFYEISLASARLVKKYNGSISGEHGDGRVRAPFLKELYGDRIYAAFRMMKSTWDPQHIFNPGKIVDAPPMNEQLRYDEDHVEHTYETLLDFSSTGGILRTAEKCNGSGDCRKLPLSGGTMCPSYMATRHEKDTTRARANVLREVLTRSDKDISPWTKPELSEALDLCLSCKGCTSECPSNIDMSTIKAEVQYQAHKVNGVPLRSRIFANYDRLNRIVGFAPRLSNAIMRSHLLGGLIKSAIGIHRDRSMPALSKVPLSIVAQKWIKNQPKQVRSGEVYLFCDEFTNWNDSEIGVIAIRLLQTLGYRVRMIDHAESGRAAISKGLLDRAKRCANDNVDAFSKVVTDEVPLIGIEPSAILSFRDEYPRLVDKARVADARMLAAHTFTIEEWLYREVQAGRINSSSFSDLPVKVLLHGHCHQKALTDIHEVAWLLSLPAGHDVEIIPSGCCGMAGSFGYEKEHFDLSMQIGEMVLFPAVRSASANTIIAASGTSCRHQIKDGTGRWARHVVEILWAALK